MEEAMAVVIPDPGTNTRDYHGCNALILDPVLGERRELRETLTNLGCASVQDTSRTHEAWAALRQGTINTVFMDWSEEIDAVEFLHALRLGDNEIRFTPVVVMSAYRRPEDMAVIRDAGATEFMLRPFPPEAVNSRLTAIMHQPRMFIANGTFFGPDRRRRRAPLTGPDRRAHHNWRGAERRAAKPGKWLGPERRQNEPAFAPLERRVGLRA
jgi:two-component system, chemotaxis family, chemotaxis protein CheY